MRLHGKLAMLCEVGVVVFLWKVDDDNIDDFLVFFGVCSPRRMFVCLVFEGALFNQ